MNKMYTMIAALLLTFATFAAERPRSGRLTIATNDNSEIRAEIDGRRYTEKDNTVRINNIQAGYHSIQVYRRQSSGIFRGNNREQLVYSTNLYVKPETQVDILIDRNGRARIQEYDLSRKGRNNRKNDDWDRRNDNGRWEDYDSWDRNNDRRDDDRWNERPGRGYDRAVSHNEFQSMKQTLRRENFENTRLTLAKQMIDRNSFESAQVKEMMQMFSFESNRLEIAKYAYRNTVDKNSFYTVYDAFSFNSSKDELSRYISNVR